MLLDEWLMCISSTTRTENRQSSKSTIGIKIELDI